MCSLLAQALKEATAKNAHILRLYMLKCLCSLEISLPSNRHFVVKKVLIFFLSSSSANLNHTSTSKQDAQIAHINRNSY